MSNIKEKSTATQTLNTHTLGIRYDIFVHMEKILKTFAMLRKEKSKQMSSYNFSHLSFFFTQRSTCVWVIGKVSDFKQVIYSIRVFNDSSHSKERNKNKTKKYIGICYHFKNDSHKNPFDKISVTKMSS